MENGPISVSAPGKSLIGAFGQDITFNTKYPFHKLDSTNNNSFQIISIFFNTEPPNPATPASGATTQARTLVYSFDHGYTYEPSSWFLVSVDNFSNVLGSEGSWIYGNASGFGSSIAKFEIEVTDTSVNFYVNKYWPNPFGILPPAPNIIGTTVTIRSYVFVEDLTGTMIPSHV